MVMGELTTRTDVAVIGGGPGGYTAAIRAAQLGMDVILVEKGEMGGVCTNVGCIPTKALIHAAEVRHHAESEGAKKMGIEAKVTLDFGKTQKWKDGVVKSLRDGVETLCKLNGVEILKGRAFFTSSNTLSVETEAGLSGIEFRKAIIATGTVIKGLDSLPYDHERIIDSTDALALDEIPKGIIIVGGGYIAVELACMFMNFGSKVTIVYRGERLLKAMEPELSEILLKKMEARGVDILFGSDVAEVKGNTATVSTPDGRKQVGFEKMLVAVGREPYFDGLGLEKTKVKLDREGRIAVDRTMKTDDPSIFAIGDVVPGAQLAHKAFRQGRVAAEVIAGGKSAFDNIAMPMVVFSNPEIASVGLTEEEAKKRGAVKIGKMPFSASGKAKILNMPDGFVKVVADGNGTLLGVHIVGTGAENLIAEAGLALEMGAMLEDLAATIHVHPTLPEVLAEAAEDALGKAVHLYRGRAEGKK